MISEQQARQVVPRVVRSLEQAYGPPAPPEEGEALAAAVRAVLQEYVSDRNASAAMHNFTDGFVDWNEVRVSTAYQVSEAIGGGEAAEEATRRIMALLSAVFRARNEMSLDFLRDGGPTEAREFLDGVENLGPPLAAKIQMLVLGHASVIVTSDVVRIAQRLGWVREDYDEAQTQRRLERVVSKALMPALHWGSREHARKTCLAQNPRCKGCPVLKQCPYGREAQKQSQTTTRDTKKSAKE